MGRNPNMNTEQTLGRKAEICLGVLEKKRQKERKGERERRKEKKTH